MLIFETKVALLKVLTPPVEQSGEIRNAQRYEYVSLRHYKSTALDFPSLGGLHLKPSTWLADATAIARDAQAKQPTFGCRLPSRGSH